MVLFVQLDDEVASGRFFGLGLRAVPRREEEGRFGLPAEVVTQDVEGVERIAEGAGEVFGGNVIETIERPYLLGSRSGNLNHTSTTAGIYLGELCSVEIQARVFIPAASAKLTESWEPTHGVLLSNSELDMV